MSAGNNSDKSATSPSDPRDAWLYLCRSRVEEARRLFEEIAANDFADVPRDYMWLSTMNTRLTVGATSGALRESRRRSIFSRTSCPPRSVSAAVREWSATRPNAPEKRWPAASATRSRRSAKSPWLASLFERSPDAIGEAFYQVATSEHGALDIGHTFGTLADGGAFEFVWARLALFRDGRLVGVELFEVEDLEISRARFGALGAEARA